MGNDRLPTLEAKPFWAIGASILDGMPRYDLSSLPPQYVVARPGAYVAHPDWVQFAIAGWTIHVSPSLRTCPILVADQPVGLLLGEALQCGKLLGPDSPLVLASSFEQTELQGNWLAFVEGNSGLIAKMDPCGRIPLVFSRLQQCIASSPGQDCFHSQFNENLYKSLGMPDSGRYFPFGLTPYEGVERLIPNHELNLETMEPRRVWLPKRELTFEDALPKIADRVRANVQAVLNLGSTSLTLTAGYDSRVILAASRGHLDGVRSYTILGNAMDPLGSRRLSSLANLNTTFLDATKATESERNAFLERSGRCIAGGVCDYWPTFLKFDADNLLVGSGGEIFRHYWSAPDAPSLDAAKLLSLMGFPSLPELVDAAEAWLDPLSDQATGTILDLAYIEQRMGTWSGPETVSGCGFPGFTPFNDRQIVDWGLAIPYEQRANDAVPHEIIRILWPELLSVPINEEPWTDVWVRRYKKVVRKMRGF